MPVIKSAKKRMRQNLKRRERNYPVRSEMKTMIKKVLKLVKDGDLEGAKKVLPLAYAVVDKATKKKILHGNNAARKKSLMARAVNNLEANGAAVKPEPVKKKSAAKKKVEKTEKVEAPKEEAKKEETE